MSELDRKIVTSVKIATLWYNHNDKTNYNSVPKTIKFLTDAAEKARSEGYTNVVVRSRISEGDENNLEQHYIDVIGDRMETADEYRRRLQQMQSRNRTERDEYERRRNLEETGWWAKRNKEIEDALNAFND